MASSERLSKTIDEDQKNQPEKPKGGWNAAIFVILVEMVERFAFYGLATNLITYLTNELKESTATAAKMVNTWVGLTLILPLFGAFVADSLLGRFNTILISSIIYCTGMGLLSISASIFAGYYRKLFFFTSLYIVATGEAGHRPCVLTFAADQFAEEMLEDKKTKSSFYNWWNFAVVIGATLANFGIVYLEDNVGWGLAFGLVAASMTVALAIFASGMKRYRREVPMGSAYTTVVKVVIAAFRKRNATEAGYGVYHCGNESTDKTGQAKVRSLVRTNQFRFLDKAMTLDEEDMSGANSKNPWRLCSQNQVEEVKLLLRLTPVWLFSLVFAVANSLLHTYFTKQAETMRRSLGSSAFKIPSASLQGVTGITSLFAIPFYERALVPTARRLTGHPRGLTSLQRVGAGLFLAALTMLISGLVEGKRVGLARSLGLLDSPGAEVPIRVWWLLPQYALCGVANVFAAIGMQELFYDQMPVAMRSLGSAANLSSGGVGSFVGIGIIWAVQGISGWRGGMWLDDNINRAHLDYFYYSVAAISALNLCGFVWFAKGFLYKKFEEETVIQQSKV